MNQTQLHMVSLGVPLTRTLLDSLSVRLTQTIKQIASPFALAYALSTPFAHLLVAELTSKEGTTYEELSQLCCEDRTQPTLAFVLRFYNSHPQLLPSCKLGPNYGRDLEKQSLNNYQRSTRSAMKGTNNTIAHLQQLFPSTTRNPSSSGSCFQSCFLDLTR